MNMTKEEFLKMIETHKNVSKKIANLYLERFPRKLCCEVNIGPSALILASFLLEVNDDEIAILQECMKYTDDDSLMRRDATTLEDVLKEKGYTDLLSSLRKPLYTDEKKKEIDHLSKCFSCKQTPYIDYVNVHDLKKYATFGYFEYRSDEAPKDELYVELPLTDDEFRDILAKCLCKANRFTMNDMIADMPILCQKLMRIAMADTYLRTDGNAHPFILDMTEIKSVAARILNPSEDILGLFKSDDEDIKEFLHENQLIDGKPSSYDCEA